MECIFQTENRAFASKLEYHIKQLTKVQKENLIKRLETDVDINRSQRGKGTITISFKNDTDFERIISLLE